MLGNGAICVYVRVLFCQSTFQDINEQYRHGFYPSPKKKNVKENTEAEILGKKCII